MKIFAISDLHLDETQSKPMNIFGDIWAGHKEEILKSAAAHNVCADDCLIVAGDTSWAMKLDDAKADLEFFKNFPCRVILLRGNHDYWWGGIGAVRAALPPNVHAIQNDAVKINGVIFCGTRGWDAVQENGKQTAEDKKIYNRELVRLGLTLSAAKKLQTEDEPIVLVMHYPPFNNKKSDNPFLRAIDEAGVKTVVFGHLHGKYHGCAFETVIGQTKYYLTSCDFLQNKLAEIIV